MAAGWARGPRAGGAGGAALTAGLQGRGGGAVVVAALGAGPQAFGASGERCPKPSSLRAARGRCGPPAAAALLGGRRARSNRGVTAV